jgi:hypothetical protein
VAKIALFASTCTILILFKKLSAYLDLSFSLCVLTGQIAPIISNQICIQITKLKNNIVVYLLECIQRDLKKKKRNTNIGKGNIQATPPCKMVKKKKKKKKKKKRKKKLSGAPSGNL